MPKDNEFTVSGLDILNLVAGIDERLSEVKEVSNKYEEEHPQEPKPDYKNISLKIINRVVRNILNGSHDDIPYIIQRKIEANMLDKLGIGTMNKVDGKAGVNTAIELKNNRICSTKSKNNGLSGENQTIFGVDDLVNGLVKKLV
jgi:hypothetical protein